MAKDIAAHARAQIDAAYLMDEDTARELRLKYFQQDD